MSNDLHMMNPTEYLNSFSNFESHLQSVAPGDFNLNRVSELLEACGNPQKTLRVIHVAGTKGKGSTCAFISFALAASGARVGLFTSPHLHQVNERIRILDRENINSGVEFCGSISDVELSDILNQMRPAIVAILNRGGFLTYFEVLTVCALMQFAKQKVDWVVLETGLGGRLDATNAVESLIAVITPISLDHIKILGKDIAAIAFEKAGIIKNSRQRVIIATQEPVAMDVILKRCQEFGIPPIVADMLRPLPTIRLKGEHQKINAATALAVLELLKQWQIPITDEQIAKGFEATRWEGRFETLERNPHVIADCAHNVASTTALFKTVKEEYPSRRIICILGLSADKDIEGICAVIKANADFIILTQANHPRAFVFDVKKAKTVFDANRYVITDSVAMALENAKKDANNVKDIILVAGSVFVVAEARKAIKGN